MRQESARQRSKPISLSQKSNTADLILLPLSNHKNTLHDSITLTHDNVLYHSHKQKSSWSHARSTGIHNYKISASVYIMNIEKYMENAAIPENRTMYFWMLPVGRKWLTPVGQKKARKDNFASLTNNSNYIQPSLPCTYIDRCYTTCYFTRASSNEIFFLSPHTYRNLQQTRPYSTWQRTINPFRLDALQREIGQPW